MKVQYREEMANYSDPESCVARREVCSEALAGETDRPAIEPRNKGNRDADEVAIIGRQHGAWRYTPVMHRSRAVEDPEHVGKRFTRKLGGLNCV